MPKVPTEFLGILPSLEVLPFFACDLQGQGEGSPYPFQMKAHSSYGEISRNMLTRKIMGGVVPWEIFVADVLALPGQRACWKVPMFLHACPTELVLREPIYRAFHPSTAASRTKLPPRLTIGVESQNSLTKAQLQEWLGHWMEGRSIELTFCMLPMNLLIKALEAETIDAMIAPTPWGIHAESVGFGKVDPQFSPGKFAQKLVVACHRSFLERHTGISNILSRNIAAARTRLRGAPEFGNAVSRMSGCGKPFISPGLLEQAAVRHSFSKINRDIVPDVKMLIAELAFLGSFSALPAQMASDEQTARLLLPM